MEGFCYVVNEIEQVLTLNSLMRVVQAQDTLQIHWSRCTVNCTFCTSLPLKNQLNKGFWLDNFQGTNFRLVSMFFLFAWPLRARKSLAMQQTVRTHYDLYRYTRRHLHEMQMSVTDIYMFFVFKRRHLHVCLFLNADIYMSVTDIYMSACFFVFLFF